eukprot:TRINITY_DN57492_c0_g1_i1.p1 TRINITY_DN57492_c0_g1~~TRINITY_DN57492_c0_g1_i1.p1  ORF type:complete len:113 (+),score=26.41 TRINITY_DN57492_c0_g1_i1:265-603(+)
MHVVTRTAPITLCLEINLNPEHNFTIIEAAIQKRVSANGKGTQSLFAASNSTEWNIAQKTKAAKIHFDEIHRVLINQYLKACLLYTSDAADEEDSVDLGGRRIIKKKKKIAE